MVSPQNPSNPNYPPGSNYPQGNVAPPQTVVAPSDRGLVHEEVGYGTAPVGERYEAPSRSILSFRSVIGGSLLALTLMIFSGTLAYALGISGYAGGSYGFGSALWAIITSAVAFFFGDWAAGYLLRWSTVRSALMNGLTVFTLCIPLLLIGFAGLLGNTIANNILGANVSRMLINPSLTTPMAGEANILPWGIVLAMLAGLICSALGGLASCGANLRDVNRRDLMPERRTNV